MLKHYMMVLSRGSAPWVASTNSLLNLFPCSSSFQSRNHKPNYEILSLNDYRTRYNQYSERLLPTLHRSAPQPVD